MPNIVSRTIRKEIWQSVYTLWDARKEGKILDKEHWQKYVPISVVTSLEYKVTVFWNQQLQTEKTIPNNKPDIVIRDNEKWTCLLIDSAIKKGMWSSKKTKRFKNLKTLQYKHSTCGVWSDIKNNNRSIFKHSQNTWATNIPVNHEIKELQKIATLCAVHILRKVLMYGTRISDGKQHWI